MNIFPFLFLVVLAVSIVSIIIYSGPLLYDNYVTCPSLDGYDRSGGLKTMTGEARECVLDLSDRVDDAVWQLLVLFIMASVSWTLFKHSTGRLNLGDAVE